MEDGFQVIAKTPYSIAGPKHYATASEAATLQYLHSRNIPVPMVYGYSSSNNNPVGIEYTLMEKASGVNLATMWLSMSKKQRHKLASSFVEIERQFFDIPFGSIGSIYYKRDIPTELQASLYDTNTDNDGHSEIFCIGPTADYMFWHGARATFDLDRGPWNDPKRYLASIAEKEIEWARRIGKPVELDFPHNGVFPGVKYPEAYIDLLDKYLTLVPYLIPKDMSSPFNRPTLRHPDLNPNNIFISPETGTISCIIDWQHSKIEPRFLAAGYPRVFESPDPEPSSELIEPTPPTHHEATPAEEKAAADELYRRRLLFYYYRIFNGHLNKPHLETLRDPILFPRQHLIDRAGRQWNGNTMTLKGALLRIIEYWPHLPETAGVSCPVEFSDSETSGFHEQEELWFSLNKVVEHWRDQLGGVNEDGWISSEKYDDCVRKVAELKASLIATAEGDQEDISLLEKGWLFRDREECQ
ncbi:phosphotransferase enzyme family protein [Aspergillus sclerotioniger CBS 115572]|uniref:Phosphotransferase enzyme family protein n=1 Tax=Aspergillus sclerotioniger CBS 115572 TaxID=1450535 RepID=A0A317X5Q6_9EURO|nr:phosphotransferase enzyme family protein [Aspergillus sclerotioniger CBS 115572]PWY91880.1 phosphotransferase enzyme family protein [Aspergillus sclerotioniger CBS 115572]